MKPRMKLHQVLSERETAIFVGQDPSAETIDLLQSMNGYEWILVQS